MSIIIKLAQHLLLVCLVLPLTGHAVDPFDNLPDPTRHKQTLKKTVKQVKRTPLVLQSTLVSEDYSHAIINGKSIAIGERIGGATLLAINPFDVVIMKNGRQIKLPLVNTNVVRKHEPTINDD